MPGRTNNGKFSTRWAGEAGGAKDRSGRALRAVNPSMATFRSLRSGRTKRTSRTSLWGCRAVRAEVLRRADGRVAGAGFAVGSFRALARAFGATSTELAWRAMRRRVRVGFAVVSRRTLHRGAHTLRTVVTTGTGSGVLRLGVNLNVPATLLALSHFHGRTEHTDDNQQRGRELNESHGTTLHLRVTHFEATIK